MPAIHASVQYGSHMWSTLLIRVDKGRQRRQFVSDAVSGHHESAAAGFPHKPLHAVSNFDQTREQYGTEVTFAQAYK